MKLLVLKENILAVDAEDCGDYIVGRDIIYPKDIIVGWLIIESCIQSDFMSSKYIFQNGAVVKKPTEVLGIE